MLTLSHARTKLVAGLTIVAIALGASALTSPASAATGPGASAFCNMASTSPWDRWAQCQVNRGQVRLVIGCSKIPRKSNSYWYVGPWAGPLGYSFNVFMGANVRFNTDYAGFQPLRCPPGWGFVEAAWMQGFYNGTWSKIPVM